MRKIQVLKNRTFTVMSITFFTFLTGCQMVEADKLTAVPFTNVAFADEFWAPRIETNRKVTAPYAFKKCEETGRIKTLSRLPTTPGRTAAGARWQCGCPGRPKEKIDEKVARSGDSVDFTACFAVFCS